MKKQPSRALPTYHKIWFQIPENCRNPDDLQLLQKKIHQNIVELHERVLINPQKNVKHKAAFLQQLERSKSTLAVDQISETLANLVEFTDVFENTDSLLALTRN